MSQNKPTVLTIVRGSGANRDLKKRRAYMEILFDTESWSEPISEVPRSPDPASYFIPGSITFISGEHCFDLMILENIMTG